MAKKTAATKSPSSNGHAQTQNGQERPVVNDAVLRAARAEFVMNVITTRSALLDKLLDEHRDINKECGYPETISAAEYRAMFDREGIAQRVNNLYPRESWVEDPDIYETEDQEETPFETALQELNDRTHLMHFLARIDEMSGIGHFGILLLGFDDGAPLEQPIGEMDPKTGDLKPSKTKHRLMYIRAFDEALVNVASVESDPASPRVGQPNTYNVTLLDTRLRTTQSAQLPTTTALVHWTRVIHVADNRMSSEVFGTPRMQSTWNRLVDLRRLYGGSAEMFWKGAFPGYSFETNPDLTDATLDADAMREEFFRYSSGLQRYLALQGVAAKSLAPQVADPSAHVKTQLEAISIALEVPMRIFMGSERGELASSQDSRSWNRRVMRRQNTYITPMIIRPTIDRLIALGALPEPTGDRSLEERQAGKRKEEPSGESQEPGAVVRKPPPAARPTVTNRIATEPKEKPKKYTGPKYIVKWPDLNTLGPVEQADLAAKRTDAFMKYIQGQVESIVPPMHYLSSNAFHGLDDEEARSIMEAAIEQVETEQAQAPPPGEGGEPPQPGAEPPAAPPPPGNGTGGQPPRGGPPRRPQPPPQPLANQATPLFSFLVHAFEDEDEAADALVYLTERHGEQILENAFASDIQKKWFEKTKGRGASAGRTAAQQGAGKQGKEGAAADKTKTGKPPMAVAPHQGAKPGSPQEIANAIDSGDVEKARDAMRILGMTEEAIQEVINQRIAGQVAKAPTKEQQEEREKQAVEKAKQFEARAKAGMGPPFGKGGSKPASKKNFPPTRNDATLNAHSFASTQVNLTGRLGERVLELAARIPEKDLVAEANDHGGREDEPHVTILYGLHDDDPSEAAELLAGVGPVRLRLGRTSVFPANERQTQRGGPQYDVVKLEVESRELRQLNKLLRALPHTNSFPDYKPHVTLAYVQPGTGRFYEGWDDLEGMEIVLDRVKFSPADGPPTEISLVGPVENKFASYAQQKAFFAKMAADKATGGGGGKKSREELEKEYKDATAAFNKLAKTGKASEEKNAALAKMWEAKRALEEAGAEKTKAKASPKLEPPAGYGTSKELARSDSHEFQRFAKDTEARENFDSRKMIDVHKKYAIDKNLTDREEEVLGDYTGHVGVEIVGKFNKGRKLSKEEAAYLQDLDEVLAKHGGNAAGELVYRGVSGEAGQALLKEAAAAIRAGRTVRSDRYESHSFDPGRAAEFAAGTTERPVVFEVVQKTGLAGFNLSESEVLVKRGAEFRPTRIVEDVEYKTTEGSARVTVVQMEEVTDLTENAFKFGSDASRRAFFAKLAADKATGGGGGKPFMKGISTKPTENGLTGEGELDSRTRLSYLSVSKDNGITPEEVDGDVELEAMRTALEETRAFWTSNDPDARAIRRSDGLSSEPNGEASLGASVNIIMTADRNNAGAGSGGPGSAKVFWAPYSLKNREERLGEVYSSSLGVDPIYVLAHELHHAYGHGSELDNASDVAAISTHLAVGNKYNPRGVKYWLFSQGASFQVNQGQKGDKGTRANAAGRRLRYLHKRHPEELKKAMIGNIVDNEEQWQKVVDQFQQIGTRRPKSN